MKRARNGAPAPCADVCAAEGEVAEPVGVLSRGEGGRGWGRRLGVTRIASIAFIAFILSITTIAHAQQNVTVGSKKFTESYVLAEIAKKDLFDAGFTALHKQGMGGTIILWQALKAGDIDAYPEYTGTIGEEILKQPGLNNLADIQQALEPMGIKTTAELGFNDTYALCMSEQRAQQLGITKISDLKAHPELVVGVTPEFLGRKDGWKPLAARYGLEMQTVKGVEHALGYAALANGQIDIKDAYSTDAKLAENHLVVLQDDLNYFPQYKAVFLYRKEMPAGAVAALKKIEGTIDEKRMTALNASAEKSKNYATAADEYFATQSKPGAPTTKPIEQESVAASILHNTLIHLGLVGTSLLLAILIGIPLGIWARRPGVASSLILGTTGVLQTIPSLALLALLVPIAGLGISWRTAVVALFIYSLLPIVRNTATGLQDVPASLKEAAEAIGLTPNQRLWRVYMPMASRSILAGIKTAAVINVGTATLAGLIGAGGLGEPIVSGLNLNDVPTILQGAIPAALLALLVQGLFDTLDRVIIPKGLRLGEARS
jgi:osmoprotectant transport system permease protein